VLDEKSSAAHALRAGSAAAGSNVCGICCGCIASHRRLSSNIHHHPILNQSAEKMIPPLSRTAVLSAALVTSVTALNNGLALTPPMGFSSWNVRIIYTSSPLLFVLGLLTHHPFAPPSQAFSSNVTSAKMRNITRILIETGLAAKGYTSLHVDEGW
jgi:hypothetical protein